MLASIACILGLAVACQVLRRLQLAFTAQLGATTLKQDLHALQALAQWHAQHVQHGKASDVQKYYTATTDRDYRLLRACVGAGMHSRMSLPGTGLSWAPGNVPALMCASMRVDTTDADAKVLEFGCGRGFCTLAMAALAPRVQFLGVDITEQHVLAARGAAARGEYANAQFVRGDGTCVLASTTGLAGIFAVESLCHLRRHKDRRRFLRTATHSLRPGGRLAVLDGFRADTFASCDADAQTALEIAERGMHIFPLATPREWIETAEAVGLKLVLEQDCTPRVLPFWRVGWRVARVLLPLARVLTAQLGGSGRGVYTVGNLLACATTAHALHARAATYRLLVFEHVVS
jgi:SAM-dependent methyltransferase